MRRIVLAAWIVTCSACGAGAETMIRAPGAEPRQWAWSTTISTMADQVRLEGGVHVGSLSARIGGVSRVADASRILHLEGFTAGLGADFGVLAIGVDWVDYGEQVVSRIEGGQIVADTILYAPVVTRSEHPAHGLLLTARIHRPPFAIDLRTLTPTGANRGSLLPVQAVAEWAVGRIGVHAGYGRPAPHGQLGFEPRAFAGLSLSLGPGARSGTSSNESGGVTEFAEFRAHRSGGLIRVEVEAPRARSVEIASDRNGWEPVGLALVGSGRWEGSFASGPGPVRILMRIDAAAWQPPPGLPVAHEPTTGNVGIIAPAE